MHSTLRSRPLTLTLAVLTTAAATGCASLSQQEEGAIIGAGAGAAVGGVIGKAAGSTTKGVIIGAVVGGAAGAVIGRQMDQKAERLENRLENATVERVGEGILVTFDSGILFDFDSSTLRPEARENLTNLTTVVGDDAENFRIMVAGHTDSVGTETYNEALSLRRAEGARNYLVSRGIASANVTTVGLGEIEPVASNETEAGRQQNRRVEVAIYASEEYQEEMIRRHGGGVR